MARWARALSPALVLGVGAAFDFHAGTRVRAPRWMQKAGLEWLHRLLHEPGRLGRRYLVQDSAFITIVAHEFGLSVKAHLTSRGTRRPRRSCDRRRS